MKEHQKRFLKDEFFSLTLMATVQRAGIYAKGTTAQAKSAFRTNLLARLEELAATYRDAVSEEKHISNIVSLSSTLSKAHANTLTNHRFRIGAAQKALNLYLKYLWCVGEIPTPPHCPFDYRVIQKLPSCKGVSWTALDNIDEYSQLVVAAKGKAQETSLAEWELQVYNNAQQIAPAGAPKAMPH